MIFKKICKKVFVKEIYFNLIENEYMSPNLDLY